MQKRGCRLIPIFNFFTKELVYPVKISVLKHLILHGIFISFHEPVLGCTNPWKLYFKTLPLPPFPRTPANASVSKINSSRSVTRRKNSFDNSFHEDIAFGQD